MEEPELDRLAAMAGAASAEAAVSAAEPGQDLTAAAFFDVDNTMMMGASIFHFARGLVARKYVKAIDLFGFAWKQLKFRIGGREDQASIDSSRDQLLSFVAGRTVQ